MRACKEEIRRLTRDHCDYVHERRRGPMGATITCTNAPQEGGRA